MATGGGFGACFSWCVSWSVALATVGPGGGGFVVALHPVHSGSGAGGSSSIVSSTAVMCRHTAPQRCPGQVHRKSRHNRSKVAGFGHVSGRCAKDTVYVLVPPSVRTRHSAPSSTAAGSVAVQGLLWML